MPTEQEIAAAKAAEETNYVQSEEEKAWAEMQAEEAGAAAPTEKAPPENLDTFADDKQNDIDASSDAAAAAAKAAAAAPGNAPPSNDKETLIRTQLEAQERARENATSDHAVRSITGRIEGMKRRLAEMAAERDREPDAADKDEVAESLEALAADYPEVAEPVRKINSALDAKVSKLAEAENSRRAAADSALLAEVQANQALLEEKHPGWGKFLSDHSADFKTWIDDQPRKLRDGFYNNEKDLVDPDGAIAVLDAFKGFLEPPADPPPAIVPANVRGLDAKRAAQLAATSTPASIRGKPVATGVQRDGDEGVIWKQMADIDPEEKPYRRA